MKRVGYSLAFALCVVIAGCAAPQSPDAPLETSGETAPPPGCEDLRERGGAC